MRQVFACQLVVTLVDRERISTSKLFEQTFPNSELVVSEQFQSRNPFSLDYCKTTTSESYEPF